MGRRAEDVIPADILAAAKAAGLKAPLWYVGRRAGNPGPRKKTLHDLICDARRKTGLCVECYHPHPIAEPCTEETRCATEPDLPPVRPDRFPEA